VVEGASYIRKKGKRGAMKKTETTEGVGRK